MLPGNCNGFELAGWEPGNYHEGHLISYKALAMYEVTFNDCFNNGWRNCLSTD